jgi:hypothetical protein
MDNELPAEVVRSIWREAEKYAEDKVKTINEEHFNVYNAYIAGATEYAIKLLQCDKTNSALEETNRGLIEHNKAWKEECERLAKVAEFWQQEYYKLNPPHGNL